MQAYCPHCKKTVTVIQDFYSDRIVYKCSRCERVISVITHKPRKKPGDTGKTKTVGSECKT